MTHLEQYEAMLGSADICYEVYEKDSGGFSIRVERGYSSFYTYHEFDPQGKLVDTGAYE